MGKTDQMLAQLAEQAERSGYGVRLLDVAGYGAAPARTPDDEDA